MHTFTTFQAVVMGITQGLSEWLPISSTAHMSIVRAIFGWRFDEILFTAFKAVIQWGTVFAAVVYFREDILSILFGKTSRNRSYISNEADRRLLIPIIVGTLPLSIIGLLLNKKISLWEDNLFVIGGSLIVFALILGLAEARHSAKRSIGTVSVVDGLIVGLGQTFSLIPGASRSGTTITAALGIGLERATAARFSFLLSLPAVFLAGAYELIKYRHEIISLHIGKPMLIATVFAFIFGYASIDWLMKFLKNHPTYVFIVYRIVVGGALLYFAKAGIIH